MANTRLTIFARTDVGRVRTNNEDAFLVSDLDSGARLETPAFDVDVRDRGILLLVSDGMGGHAAGDVASALVVESMRKTLSDPLADGTSLQRLIDHAVQRANQDVHEAAQAAEKRGMGATLTAILVHDTEAYVAEVGDSRGYLLRAGRLRQITKDQSFVQMLVDIGAMSAEQAKDAPQKNIILQAMGREEALQVSIGRLHLRRGDRLLLCSDGVSNMVPDAELRALLGDDDLATVADRMVDLANERGGPDNGTAIVALVEGEELITPPEGEEVTQTIEVLQEYLGPGATPRARAASTPTPAPTPAATAPAPSPKAAAPAPAPAAPKSPLSPGVLIAVALGVAFLAWLAWRAAG